MQLYKTTLTRDNAVVRVTWQGSQAEANKARTAAKAEGCKATSEHVNIPTDKSGLLEWLNETN